MEYVYQWGVSGLTINNPQKETLQHYIDRKRDVNVYDKVGALNYLANYKNRQSPTLEYFIGTEAEFAEYALAWPIRVQAQQGQFALNIMYVESIMMEMFELAIHHKLFNNNPNSNIIITDTLHIDYLIEASKINRGAIDHFSQTTKDMLVILFTKLETTNTESLEGKIDELYAELKEILKEFEQVDQEADLPKELVSILDTVHAKLHGGTK